MSNEILHFLGVLDLDDETRFDIRLCLEEALINAIKYGHRMDEKLKVRVLVECDPGRVSLTIEDNGPGFNLGALKDCTKEDNLLSTRGRGVYLIHRLMDQVKYNDKGNKLKMIKFLRRRSKKSR